MADVREVFLFCEGVDLTEVNVARIAKAAGIAVGVAGAAFTADRLLRARKGKPLLPKAAQSALDKLERYGTEAAFPAMTLSTLSTLLALLVQHKTGAWALQLIAQLKKGAATATDARIKNALIVISRQAHNMYTAGKFTIFVAFMWALFTLLRKMFLLRYGRKKDKPRRYDELVGMFSKALRWLNDMGGPVGMLLQYEQGRQQRKAQRVGQRT